MRQVSLPGASKAIALQVQRQIDILLSSKQYGTDIPQSSIEWLQSVDNSLVDRLVELRLAPEMGGRSTPITDLFTEFLAIKQGKSASTYTNYKQFERTLVFFGGRAPRDITTTDGDDFRDYCLRIMKLGENTTRKRCAQASTFFRWLMSKNAMSFNPFEHVPKTVGTAIEEKKHIPAEDITRVMKEAPNAEWRALIVLGRWGGIRIPSEAFGLKWEHVNWETNRITIPSPKTAHQGKASRVIPLFPELTPVLLELAEQSESEYLIAGLRVKSGNVRTPFLKMIKRAGLEPWPGLWKALRSTRETELAATYPIHVVGAWMGNTEQVARRHYLKVTEADIEKAVLGSAYTVPTSVTVSKRHGAT